MGKGKRIIILASFLVSMVVPCAWCIEEDSAKGFPDDLGNRLERLQIYFEAEMYEEASVMLDELIAQFPEESQFGYLRAVVDYQRQNYDRAEKVFDKFIEKYPQVAEPYYLLGQINLKKDRLKKAKQYLAKYCQLAPEDYEAQSKLNSISNNAPFHNEVVMKAGKENSNLVKKVGFYGACVYAHQSQCIKLINGRFRDYSSMGIDFTYPVDLRGKQVVINLRGRQGGERFELTFRDKLAPDYNSQLVSEPRKISYDWQNVTVTLAEADPNIDLSQIVHIGLEFGATTVHNPPVSTIFVKDIIIEDVRD